MNFEKKYEKVERDIEESILRKLLENDYDFMKSKEEFIKKILSCIKKKWILLMNTKEIFTNTI